MSTPATELLSYPACLRHPFLRPCAAVSRPFPATNAAPSPIWNAAAPLSTITPTLSVARRTRRKTASQHYISATPLTYNKYETAVPCRFSRLPGVTLAPQKLVEVAGEAQTFTGPGTPCPRPLLTPPYPKHRLPATSPKLNPTLLPCFPVTPSNKEKRHDGLA